MGLNDFQLKCIAVLSMLIDHIGMILFPEVTLLRMIGRLAFPMFCFLLVEGFYHTHNVERYMVRLGVFALISEIPFDLARFGVVLEFSHQNVFFTLFIGVAMMYGLQKYCGNLVKIVIIVLAMAFAALLSTDYSFLGILLILVYYLLRDDKVGKLVLGAGWNLLSTTPVQYCGIFAVIPLGMYNGEKGRSLKWAFYIFYPAHLLALYGIKMLFFN